MNELSAIWYRLKGHQIGDGVKFGRHAQILGTIKLGNNVELQDNVVLSGNISVGSNSVVQKTAELHGNIEIGEQTVIGSLSFISTMPSASIVIGNDVLINSFSIIGAAKGVKIGDHCIFAAYVHITDSSHGIENPDELTKHAPWKSAPIVIEENVWLGSAVMVGKGTTVGRGAVIGAKSLVSRDVPCDTIAFGVPARVARYRREAPMSSEAPIDEMLHLKA